MEAAWARRSSTTVLKERSEALVSKERTARVDDMVDGAKVDGDDWKGPMAQQGSRSAIIVETKS